MEYAVIRIQGKQYKVTKGQEILVDKMNDLKAQAEVLLYVKDDEVLVGKPVLSDVKVKFKVVTELEKGEKLDIYRFKSKSRSRKHTGFRPQYTRLLIDTISK